MLRWIMTGAVAAAILLSPEGVADAEPVAPRVDTPCTPDVDGAMTWPAGATAPLVCADARWETVTDPYPISDRWLSVGPAMTLHGQGRPNPNLLSGNWTATPLTPESSCKAVELAVIPGSPTIGAPQVTQGSAGQPLPVDVVPVLYTIEMTGDCLWQKSP